MPVSGVPGAPSLPGVAHTSGCTTVTTVAVLLVETGSVPVVVTVTAFVNVPAVPGEVPLTVMVIGVTSGYATVFNVQTICPAAGGAQVPCEVTADALASVAGRVSVTTTPVAAVSPRFCSWIV